MSNQWRDAFPALDQRVNDERLAYLDNAATSQKPQAVIDALTNFYQSDNANVHRCVHTLAERATQQYEEARKKIQHFIHAGRADEIVFTKGCTEGLNLIASTYGNQFINPGDEIVITVMEHHSNLIPWQQLAIRKQAALKYIGITSDGQLDMAQAAKLITDRTKIVAVTHVSNVLGTINPIQQLSTLAHQHHAVLVVDGAQAVAHFPVNVQELGADFYAFSGHKMYGPTGIGVLYGRHQLLSAMPPYQYGGEMITEVHQQVSRWADPPSRFEAGTPNIAGAIGLGAAVDYLNHLAMTNIQEHEQAMMDDVLPRLNSLPVVTVYGPHDPSQHSGVVAFNIAGIHPHDVATALDMDGVAVRAGHHCAQPLMEVLGVPATVRASFGLYNNQQDADQLLQAIQDTKEFFNNGAR